MTSRDHLQEARSRIEQVCAGLVSPTPANLTLTAGILEAAEKDFVACLSALREAPDRSLLPEVLQIRALNSRAGTLLEAAARYHNGLTQRIAALAAGYTPEGEPAPFGYPTAIHTHG